MIGTIINAVAIFFGAILGILIGRRFPKALSEIMTAIMGSVTIVMGVQMALGTKSILIPLGGLLVGVMLGEWMSIHHRLEGMAEKLEKKFY